MTRPLELGDRIVVTCTGEPRCGETGVVTSPTYPALISGRPMVDVLFDGAQPDHDEGVYIANLELARLTAVA